MNLAGRPAGHAQSAATAPELAAWRRLAAAVLLQAVEDARDGNGQERDARAFLAGDGAAYLAAVLDLPAGGLERIRAELPDLGPVQLGFWG